MPEYIGYEATTERLQLSDEQRDWFAAKEEQIGLPINVVWGAGITRLPESNRDDRIAITVFDAATPHENPEMMAVDHVYWTRWSDAVLQDGAHPEQRPQLFLALRSRHMCRYLSNRTHHVSSEGAQPYAQVEYNTLWTRIAMANLKRTQGDYTTADLMDNMIGHWIDFSMDREFFDSMEERRFEAARAEFRRQVKRITEREPQRLRERITQTEHTIADLSSQLINTEATLKQQYRQFNYLDEAAKQDEAHLDSGFMELLRGSKFKDVEYNADLGCISVYTDTLYLYSPARTERTQLGKMKIDFTPDSRIIRVYNVNNQKGSRHHPHIPSSGEPCWGGMQGAVTALLRDFEIVALFEIVLDYLEQYNPEDKIGRAHV